MNDGNTVILGSSVPSLITICQKATEAARKQSRVCIDPTITALVWNTAANHQQQEEEEGYNEEQFILIEENIYNMET